MIDLGKGRTVVLIPDKTLPYVSANLTYSGGDALLKPSEQGLSALASNVLTQGTAKRSATEKPQDLLGKPHHARPLQRGFV